MFSALRPTARIAFVLTLILFCLAGGLPTAPADETAPATTTASAGDPQWQSLLPPPDLAGFVRRGGEAAYRVEGNDLIGTTQKGAPNTFLCTERDYGDFILELDFKIDPRSNSGIQIRSQSLPEYNNGRVHGYQVEIDPREDRKWSAGIYDEARRGWLYGLENNEPAREAFRQNEWNHLTIVAVGDTIKTWINGVPAANLKDAMTPIGFIAFQVHSTNVDEPMEVRWRNIRLLPLDTPAVPQKQAPAQEQ
jgi:hypothetical protein